MKTLQDTKHYLKAKTPEGLKMLMLSNNIKKGAYHSYDIIFANGFFYAWYDGKIEDVSMEELDAIDGRKG